MPSGPHRKYHRNHCDITTAEMLTVKMHYAGAPLECIALKSGATRSGGITASVETSNHVAGAGFRAGHTIKSRRLKTYAWACARMIRTTPDTRGGFISGSASAETSPSCARPVGPKKGNRPGGLFHAEWLAPQSPRIRSFAPALVHLVPAPVCVQRE